MYCAKCGAVLPEECDECPNCKAKATYPESFDYPNISALYASPDILMGKKKGVRKLRDKIASVFSQKRADETLRERLKPWEGLPPDTTVYAAPDIIARDDK